jgi:hypothetical protein
MGFRIRDEVVSRSPAERERIARSRFWRKLVVWTLGILAAMMAIVRLFLR